MIVAMLKDVFEIFRLFHFTRVIFTPNDYPIIPAQAAPLTCSGQVGSMLRIEFIVELVGFNAFDVVLSNERF